jgi:TIR domain-containing protein
VINARIFISYRTSDGADKATTLARELGAVFGDAQVFLDKEDLPAGQLWHDGIGAALDERPVLLMLVTPDTFGARDAHGALRIDDTNDPVRRELSAALAAGAQVVPLLADGVDKLPTGLPAPLDRLGDRTWRRLRAYDWRSDFERLVLDLVALGVPRVAPLADERRTQRLRRGAIAASMLLGASAAAGWWWLGPQAQRLDGDVSGDWTAQVAPPANETGSRLDRVLLHLAQQGDEVRLTSRPIDITQDPAWHAFAQSWLQRFDQKLERVVWRGQGNVHQETGQPLHLDIVLSVETEAGGASIETGKLVAAADTSGRRLSGRVWMNGEQAERNVELRRGIK